jgi:hypothetical protein
MENVTKPQRSIVSRTFASFSLVLFSACLPESSGSGPSGTGGSGGAGGAAAGGRGGSSGSGTGGTGTGGSSASGGSGGGTAGAGASAGGAGGTGGSAAGVGGTGGGSGGASAGTGGSSGSGGSAGGASGAGGSTMDAAAGEAPPAAGGVELLGKVHKTLFKVTISMLQDGRSGVVPVPQRKQRNEDTFTGDASKNYEVVFRIRGLVEPRIYDGGMLDPASPFINIGGTPNTGGGENRAQYANFRLDVSEPRQVYHLNRFQMGHTDHQVYPMDYRLKVRMKGGALVAAVVDDSNCCAIANHTNKVVPGFPEDVVMQPFKDQFIYYEAESVTEVP